MNIDHLVDIVKTAKEISTISKTAKIINNNKWINENILHKILRTPNNFAITSKVKSERAKKIPMKNIENYNIFKKTLKRHILSLNIY